jgi:3-methyl-2-oxobutanoate hydroxymethyltransferase
MSAGVESALHVVKECQVDGIKLEGGVDMAPTVAAIVKAGITVIGHIGLTPQRAGSIDSDNPTYGQTAAGAKALWDDAIAIQEAGAIAIVMEAVAAPVARMITEKLRIPTIGIG